MEETDGKVIPCFTLENPSHPTTSKQADRYEFLRHSHCHRCPEQEDCDVEEFLSCQAPLNLKFRKCMCFLCIDEKKLEKIIQSYQSKPKPRKRHYQYPEDYYEDLFEETTF
jgi:hypothetical protein